jgi:hypothetical protein
MNYYYKKHRFGGYKVRPTYLERLNNYLQGVASNHPEQQEADMLSLEEETDEKYADQVQNTQQSQHSYNTRQSASNRNQPQQQNNQQMSRPTSVQNGRQPVQSNEPQRKITSNDLRNKRSNMMTGNYNYSSNRPNNRRGAKYGIRPSYTSGAFQTDGL